MNFRVFVTAATLLIVCAVPSRAQQAVEIEFDKGKVTLRAENAPVRAILAEWARLGGATIVNGDRIAGPPVTLELMSVPERQALDVVLRNVAGYMLAPRRAGTTGASTFDRILILPTSAAPRTPPPAPSAFVAPRPAPGQPRILRPPQSPAEAPAEETEDADDAGQDTRDPPAPNQRPGMRLGRPPRPFQPPQPVGTEPQIRPEENQDQPDAPGEGVAPTPTNPFGVPFGSSSTPGVVTPAPQPREPAGGRQGP